MQTSEPEARPWTGLAALGIVYVVWGSTYLAIRYAVREGSGFPAFWMAGSRVLLGGLILFAIAALLGKPLRLARRDWMITLVTAILLWNGGNGLVTWAEQKVSSGYAALVIGTTPLWGALVESILHRRRPGRRLIVSLFIGFAGLVVLTWPMLQQGGRSDWMATLALLGAPISWSIGSAYQKRHQIRQPILVSSAYQQMIGGMIFVLLALITNEPAPSPTPEAWWAWGYLVVFGSVIAFTAYVTALRALPLPVVMTYAYVNPVIAVFLGWLILAEPITPYTLAGTVLILAGVAALFHDRLPSWK